MSDNKKIRSISEGYFHSVQASNKAEKFKLSKLSQGIESCRQAQFRNYRKEEKDLLETLLKLTKQKISKVPDSGDDVLDFVNGDFDGYPQSCGLQRTSLAGPRLKVNIPEDDTCSPYEIIPEPYKESIEEEGDEDVPLHRLRSQLDASVKPIKSKSAMRRRSISRNLGDTHSGNLDEVKQTSCRRGSMSRRSIQSIYQVESGATGQKITLTKGHRRGSLPSRTDLAGLSQLSEHLDHNTRSGSFGITHPSNATIRSSNHSNTSFRTKDHQSDIIPKELKSRRFSLLDIEETVPFYLLRKYNHYHTNETPQEYFFNRFISRRNALNALDHSDIEKFRAASRGSADLGTVTLKEAEEERKTKKDVDPWEELKQRCSTLCDTSEARLTGRRGSLPDDRMAAQATVSPLLPHGVPLEFSENRNYNYGRSERVPPKDSSLTHLTVFDLHIPGLEKNKGEESDNTIIPPTPMQVNPPHQRARSNSLPSSLLASSIQRSKLLLPRHGLEMPRNERRMSLPSSLRKMRTMPDLAKIKSLKEVDNATELVDFDDADVIFPAHDSSNPNNYTLKDYRALRKCRYLRLSRLNWESLQWQARNEALGLH